MIAIIPARGGSKGLPRKNVKDLHGKPLIAYTIECALQSKYIDRVIVSTDDMEIADVSLRYGAELPFMRPDYLASDTSLAIDNYIYTIDRLSKEWNQSIDEFVVLQPTSPLRIVEDIDGAIELFYAKEADSVISYTQEAHPVYWHKEIDEEGKIKDLFKSSLSNRQDSKTTYYPNGAVYVFKSEIIRRRQYYTENTFAYIMPRNRSVDIDYLDDFLYVDYLLSVGNHC